MKIIYAFILIAGVTVLAGCGSDDTGNSGNDLRDLEEEILTNMNNGAVESDQPRNPRAGVDKEDIGNEPVMQVYTLVEVAKHSTPENCWAVVDGKIADITSFFGVHPGGDDNLALACGKDATLIFRTVAKHDPNGYAKFKTFMIGSLAQ